MVPWTCISGLEALWRLESLIWGIPTPSVMCESKCHKRNEHGTQRDKKPHTYQACSERGSERVVGCECVWGRVSVCVRESMCECVKECMKAWELQDVVRVCRGCFGSSVSSSILGGCWQQLLFAQGKRSILGYAGRKVAHLRDTASKYGGKASGKEFLQTATAQNQSLWACNFFFLSLFAGPVSFLKPDVPSGGTQNCSGSFLPAAKAGSLARSLVSRDYDSRVPAKPNKPRSIQHRLLRSLLSLLSIIEYSQKESEKIDITRFDVKTRSCGESETQCPFLVWRT